MYIFFLFLISAALALSQNLTAKFSSNALVGKPASSYAFFMVISGAVSCLFYLATNGFRLYTTPTMFLFSFGFTLALCLSNVGILTVYRYMNVANVLVILSSAQLIITAVCGKILFDETITATTVIRILVMLVCIFLMFLDGRTRSESEQATEKIKVGVKRVLITVLLLVITIASNASIVLLNKFYTIAGNVTDEKSYLFFGNLFMVAASIVMLAYTYIRSPEDGRATLAIAKTKPMIFMLINSIGGGAALLVSIAIISRLAVSVATPISSAVGMLMTVASSLILREKIGIFAYIAVALSIIVFVI